MDNLFIYYPKIDLSKGGGAVHGYNLMKSLQSLGYQIGTLNDATINGKNLKGSILSGILKCDLVYVRLHFNMKTNLFIRIVSIFKKVVVELNGPSDEILLKGSSLAEVEKIDRRLRKTLKKADHVITVSDAITQYTREILGVEHVTTINNGGERLPANSHQVTGNIESDINEIKHQFERIVIWSGTNYPWQGFKYLKELALSDQMEKVAFIIVSDDQEVLNVLKNRANVFLYNYLDRADVKYLIKQADIGCSMYGDFSLTRTGFYNSSLKFHEYMVNGLGVITSPYKYFERYKNDNVICTDDVSDMIAFIQQFSYKDCGPQRTWEDVAEDTDKILRRILA